MSLSIPNQSSKSRKIHSRNTRKTAAENYKLITVTTPIYLISRDNRRIPNWECKSQKMYDAIQSTSFWPYNLQMND